MNQEFAVDPAQLLVAASDFSNQPGLLNFHIYLHIYVSIVLRVSELYS